jgi:hypothetical protein
MQNFRSLPIYAHSPNIDEKEGVISSVAVAHATEAVGHRLLFDARSLQQLLELGNASKAGIKSRFTHPGLSDDGLGKYLGRMRNFRLRQDHLIADLHLAAVASGSPEGNLRQYVLDLAKEDPASSGVSVVASLDKFWVKASGEEMPAKNPRPEDSLYEYPVARILKFHAADLVDEPALNPNGIFSRDGSQTRRIDPLVASNKTAQEAFDFLDGFIQAAGIDHPHAFAVACQYFHSRGVDINQSAISIPKSAIQEGDQSPMDTALPYEINPEPTPNPETEKLTLSDEIEFIKRVAAQARSLQQEIINLTGPKSAISNQQSPIQIGGIAPRGGNLAFGPSGLEAFQGAWDWLFGAPSAKLPSPSLRRTDELYRILTGDIGYQGVFRPEYAFAGASTTTLADMAVNAMNKVIIDLYQALEPYRWYEMITAVQPTDGSLQDMAWIQFGGIATLPTVAEGASYTELTVGDTKESDAFTKYGGYVGITDKMLRNSEIARLQAIPRALTIAAVRTRSAKIAAIFTVNTGTGPTLDQDSTVLFHANHSNVQTTAYSIAAWKAARLECAKQTELTSAARTMLWPKFFLGPADLYDTALIDFGYGAGTGGYTGTPNNDVNPYAQSRPGDPRPIPIAVPEWTDTGDWAYITDPLLNPVICMAYANNPAGARSHPAPELFTVTSPTAGLLFTNDTLPIKVRDYFAYGVATYRGIGKRNVA